LKTNRLLDSNGAAKWYIPVEGLHSHLERKPKLVFFENVDGVDKCTRKRKRGDDEDDEDKGDEIDAADLKTCLDLLVEDIKMRHPDYAVRKLACDAGENFGALPRSRRFLLMAHESVGGESYMEEVMSLFNEISAAGESLTSHSLDDVLLYFDPNYVRQRLEEREAKV
jgi:hypothetical protein